MRRHEWEVTLETPEVTLVVTELVVRCGESAVRLELRRTDDPAEDLYRVQGSLDAMPYREALEHAALQARQRELRRLASAEVERLIAGLPDRDG